jgi:DNA-directed RNA polymerase subunit delta
MEKKSMLDIAYDLVKETDHELSFKDIWNHIVETLSLPEDKANDKIASFYTNLTLDGRFVDLGNNTWDLRTKHTYDKVHFDLNDAYSIVEDEVEENEEEDLYDELIKKEEDKDDLEEKEEESDDLLSEIERDKEDLNY